MDPLTQQLLQRQLTQQSGTSPPTPAPPSVPAVPPNPHPHEGSEADRFKNAQAIQAAYRGGWQPNPVLLQASLTK